MNTQQPPTRHNYNSKLEGLLIRLTARLCVILISLTQIISRSLIIFTEPHINKTARFWYSLSLPFLIIISIIVGIEYILFKKMGPRVVKYSKIVDMILLVFFTIEWLFTLTAGLCRLKETSNPSFGFTAVFSFTNFSWRAMLMTIIIQKWQLKIIPPILATGMVMGFSIHYDPENVATFVLRGILQIIYVSLLLYFEDKMRWKMLLINMRQEKWVQINDFILNNIPENIMILDLEGNTKFISDYCKSFLESCSLSSDIKEFFGRIRDLSQQFTTETTSPNSANEDTERQITMGNLLNVVTEQNLNPENVQVLEELITNFKRIIKAEFLKERQFLIYNGKLKVENQQDKSIELKLSYIKQFEREYIILIIRDTTQRDLLVTLSDNNKYKDQLLASVSHELRAPLNGNINWIESAVASVKIPHDIKESLLIPALRSSKFLLHLINDILDMSQIKEKKLRLVFQSENLRDTLKSTAQLVELQAKKKGIELLIEIDLRIRGNFCTDHIRLSQIVLNLLHNAIKFTQRGTVKLTAEPVDENPSWIKISVEDSGIGMAPGNLQKLFSNYTRIEFEGRTQINPTGVGLGLNIANNLVEFLAPKNQAGISVESTLNQGSIFSFILENKMNSSPLRFPDHQMPGSCSDVAEELLDSKRPLQISRMMSPSSALFQAGGIKSDVVPLLEVCCCPQVLIVDDNPFNTMAFETILGSLDVQCEAVYSGSAAIEKLLSREKEKCGKDCKGYSVVFMDQEMPEMSGSETVREIRKLERENKLPVMRIIGCTAHKSKEEVDRFLESGIEQCIHKPISTVMIKDILSDIL